MARHDFLGLMNKGARSSPTSTAKSLTAIPSSSQSSVCEPSPDSFAIVTTTAGTALAGDGAVVCHGDLGQHNTVFRGEQAVGLIDGDDGVGPGQRLVDFAHAVWCFAGVGEREVPISYQASALKIMCNTYGWGDPERLIDEIADRMRRARDEHARQGRFRAVVVFQEMIASMNTIEPDLRKRLV